MDDIKVKNRIEKLRQEISRLRFLYHVENSPNVTDDVYESLTRELHQLEMKYPKYSDLNSSIYRVAGKPLPNFKKVKHEIRMLSLNDAFSEEEIIDWEKRITKLINIKTSEVGYFCEVKLDGLSASLFYKDGVFIRGATRGDGFIGEDVTENLKMIETIPLHLIGNTKGEIEVRGEVVMTKKSWEKLNKRQTSQGKAIFANTRNAAAGSLRQLDSSIVRERSLDFFAWDIAQLKVNDKELKINTHSEKHGMLRNFGFQLAPYEKRAKNLAEVFSFIKEVGKIRAGLPYGTDGVVISIDNIELQENLGYIGKAPRYMVAYKFPAERATTIITDITVNVGRTGTITPLAHFNPTLVAGSIISKATLHNMDQIERLDIRIGDTVVIQKAGDVIPEIVEVLTDMRTGKEKKFKMPKNCPVCGFEIERKGAGGRESFSSSRPNTAESNSVAFYCTNKNCPARERRGLQHFVNIYEIYEIGPKILDRLKDEGLITDAADLFTLEKSDLSGLERFGEKSADNIISSIESHKKVSLWRFVYALGIIHVGEQTAQDLANHFETLDKIIKAKEEDFGRIENIGPVVTKSIYEFFRDERNINFINKLLENGIVVYQQKVESKKLVNKIFVLTGTLNSLSREEAKKKILVEGGRVSSSVSKNTNYVIAGDEPGSKYNDAISLGVTVLDEKEFLKLF